MTENNSGKLLELIKSKTYQDGDRTKLNCDDALELARHQDVDPMVIAGICNRHDMRIARCRLGCFKLYLLRKEINRFITGLDPLAKPQGLISRLENVTCASRLVEE